ncbi:MAG: DUF2784 domain-containing protein [Bacteroidales bacterium]|nr:DUF2784 domain-containing protein [Bacteroidales bacterium]
MHFRNFIAMELWYEAVDKFFVIFHSALILFNVFGWIWKKTRIYNLITLLLTGGSWGLLGLFYGFGYCPLTDWHWQVLHQLGVYDLPYSYIEYLIERLTGLELQTDTVNTATYLVFIAVLGASIFINVKDYWQKKRIGKRH